MDYPSEEYVRVRISKSEAQLGKDLEDDLIGYMNDVMTELQDKLHTRNPVDTGFSSMNWSLTRGRAYNSVRGSKTNVPSKMIVRLLTKKAEVMHLTNNVKYLPALNDGWSAQAPAGWVDLAIAEVHSKYGL